MSPDDLATVNRSWAELRPAGDALVDRLTVAFAASSTVARARAAWLVEAVAELVGRLPTPSELCVRAHELACSWPDPLQPPSFRIDGTAWLGVAREVCPTWTIGDELAWRQAWLLLSDVLAEEALSPFATRPPDTSPVMSYVVTDGSPVARFGWS